MIIDKLAEKRNLVIAVVLAVIVLFPVGYYAALRAFPQGEPFLEMPDPEQHGEDCVKDTEYMRYSHMELLLEIREETVREGKRGEIGLSVGDQNCRDCHSNRERFCNECHNTANLYLDCFDCHYYPESDSEITAVAGK
jgi:hypothetical protein